jgi:hypothetical protein
MIRQNQAMHVRTGNESNTSGCDPCRFPSNKLLRFPQDCASLLATQIRLDARLSHQLEKRRTPAESA